MAQPPFHSCLREQPAIIARLKAFLSFQRYGSDGLKLVNHEETVSFGQAVLKLNFDPGSPDEGMLTAECRLDHPFFVKNKGKANNSRTICVTTDRMLFKPTIFNLQGGLHSIRALP